MTGAGLEQEALHHGTQLLGELVDLAGGVAGGVGHLQRLVAAIGDAHHVALYFVDYGALLLDGAGDHRVGVDQCCPPAR